MSMEESELTCNPTAQDLLEARKKTNAQLPMHMQPEPGVCVICKRRFKEKVIAWSGKMGFSMPKYYCSRAMDLAEEAEQQESGRKLSKWQKECPPLYKRIKPAERASFPKIDWNQYDEAMKWTLSEGLGLVLIGDTGSGKSTTLWHILLKQERAGVKWSVYDGGRLAQAYFTAVSTGSVDELADNLVAREVLAFDDFGKGISAEGIGAFLFDVINRRTEQCRPILMTTRFTGQALEGRFGNDFTRGRDIARRLNDYCKVVTFKLNGGKK